MNPAPISIAIAVVAIAVIDKERCQTFSNGTGDSITVCVEQQPHEHPDQPRRPVFEPEPPPPPSKLELRVQ